MLLHDVRVFSRTRSGDQLLGIVPGPLQLASLGHPDSRGANLAEGVTVSLTLQSWALRQLVWPRLSKLRRQMKSKGRGGWKQPK